MGDLRTEDVDLSAHDDGPEARSIASPRVRRNRRRSESGVGPLSSDRTPRLEPEGGMLHQAPDLRGHASPRNRPPWAVPEIPEGDDSQEELDQGDRPALQAGAGRRRRARRDSRLPSSLEQSPRQAPDYQRGSPQAGSRRRQSVDSAVYSQKRQQGAEPAAAGREQDAFGDVGTHRRRRQRASFSDLALRQQIASSPTADGGSGAPPGVWDQRRGSQSVQMRLRRESMMADDTDDGPDTLSPRMMLEGPENAISRHVSQGRSRRRSSHNEPVSPSAWS